MPTPGATRRARNKSFADALLAQQLRELQRREHIAHERKMMQFSPRYFFEDAVRLDVKANYDDEIHELSEGFKYRRGATQDIMEAFRSIRQTPTRFLQRQTSFDGQSLYFAGAVTDSAGKIADFTLQRVAPEFRMPTTTEQFTIPGPTTVWISASAQLMWASDRTTIGAAFRAITSCF